MANEVAFVWETGQSVKGKAWQADGSYRLSDITLTETQTGLYLGNCATLQPTDYVVVMKRTTSDVLGGGREDYDVEKVVSDIAFADAVIDQIYSDTTILISDLKVVDGVADNAYSDTTILVSDLKVVDAVADKTYSDTTIALSDLKVVAADIDSVYSDTTISTSDLETVKGKTGAIYSDTTLLVSDTAVITDLVRLKVHEFHLGNI